MSRIDLEPHEPDVWVTVGWDPPLGTYFAQVFRNGELVGGEVQDDEQIVWRGFGKAMGDELLNVDEVLNLVRPYATVPDAVKRQLILDRGRNV